MGETGVGETLRGCAVMRMEEAGGGGEYQYSGVLLGGPGGFEEHVKRLRGTMFYVCQVACHRYSTNLALQTILIHFRVPVFVVLSATGAR